MSAPDPADIPVATTGSYLRRMRDAIHLSEDSRRKARRVARDRRADVVAALEAVARKAKTGPPRPEDVENAVDAAVGTTPAWKVAVENERWGNRLTEMYALADVALVQRELFRTQRELLAVLTEVRDLLRDSLITVEDEDVV